MTTDFTNCTLRDECARCAKRERCGYDFVPRIDYGECGHCDGCLDFDDVRTEAEVRDGE